MAEESKNITCYDCGADVATEDIENGRCPKCGYDIQGHKDHVRRQEVIDRENKKRQEEEKKKTSKKRKGLF